MEFLNSLITKIRANMKPLNIFKKSDIRYRTYLPVTSGRLTNQLTERFKTSLTVQ